MIQLDAIRACYGPIVKKEITVRRNLLASVLSLVILIMGSAAWAQSLTQQVVRHCSTTLPVTFSGGEAAVLLIGFFRNVPVSFKVTDNNGGIWQEAPNYPAGGPSDRGRMTYDIWVSFNHPAGSTTITAQTTNKILFIFLNILISYSFYIERIIIPKLNRNIS